MESPACLWGQAFSLPPGFCPASPPQPAECQLTRRDSLKFVLSAFTALDRRLNMPFFGLFQFPLRSRREAEILAPRMAASAPPPPFFRSQKSQPNFPSYHSLTISNFRLHPSGPLSWDRMRVSYHNQIGFVPFQQLTPRRNPKKNRQLQRIGFVSSNRNCGTDLLAWPGGLSYMAFIKASATRSTSRSRMSGKCGTPRTDAPSSSVTGSGPRGQSAKAGCT